MAISGLSLGLGLGIGGAPGSAFSNSYSVDFDGTNDYVAMNGAASDMQGLSTLTMSFWVKAASYSVNPMAFAINWPGNGLLIYTHNSGNANKTQVWYGADLFAASTPQSLGQWDHVCYVQRASDDHTLYINGNSVATSSASYSVNSGADQVVVGGTTRFTQYHGGLIDEVALWKRGVTVSEVAAIYNGGTPGSLSSLNPFGWWRMGDNDGGTGTTITDQGSGANNGTLTNGPTFSTDVP